MISDLDVALPCDDHLERLLDEALLETFPASDPPAPAVEAAIERCADLERASNDH